MAELVLAVRAAELRRQIAVSRFLALPEEEIRRHHAMVEVVALDRDQAAADPSYRQLATCTAIHHNYSWLTHLPADRLGQPATSGRRSLFICAHIRGDGETPLFLDDQLATAAASAVDAAVSIPDRYELRLAGLLDDDSDPVGRAHLGLVYVARLKRPGVEPLAEGISGIAFRGTGELQMERDQFEPWSQILIDHLNAL